MTDFQTQLNTGDMVAQEAKYHQNCHLNLYNHAWKIKLMASKGTDDEHTIAGLAFAEMMVFIEELMWMTRCLWFSNFLC